MKESYRILPVPAGDVSGIAGMLYELGGMTVIHDPSGCNSTYNTHDETRWYRRPSYIFISGLNMRDAVLGNDEKLVRDILDAAADLNPRPRFIALCNSPVPWLSGTDFPGLARLIEKRSGIPAFYVPSNGTHDCSAGAGDALAAYLACLDAHGLLKEKKSADSSSGSIRVTLAGLAPLDYGNPACGQALKEKLSKAGFAPVCSLATDPEKWDRGEDLSQESRLAGTADVTLVLSASGLPAGRFLQEKRGIPMVIGVPVGAFSESVFRSLREAAKSGGSRCAWETKNQTFPSGENQIWVFGDPVLSISLAEHLKKSTGLRACAVSTVERGENLLRPGDLALRSEENLSTYFAGKRGTVFADPLYRSVLPQEMRLKPLPTLSLSGRYYQKDFINYFDDAALAALGSLPGEPGQKENAV